jgi:hypothetical protein
MLEYFKKTVNSMEKYFTYINKLPNGTPFYIGVGTYYPKGDSFKNKHHRAFVHNKRSDNWKKLASNGFDTDIIFRSDSRLECYKKEIDLINELGRISDGGLLVNESKGGKSTNGYKWTNEQKIKHSKLFSGQNHNFFGKKRPNVGKKIQATLKEKYSKEPHKCGKLIVNTETGLFYFSTNHP